MKKFLISFLAIICLYSFASAQRIEIFGGYSYGSLVGKLPGLTAPFDNAVNADMIVENQDQTGALTLGVNARILGNLSIGLSWTGITNSTYPLHYRGSDTYDYVKQSSNTIMFNIKYEWLKFWKLRLYSRAGIGGIFFSDPKFEGNWLPDHLDNYTWPDGKPESCKRVAWQASLVGVEFRPVKWVGVFAEGGLGRQGALLAGLKVFL
ncbi:MAG: hypothetical protein K2J42_04185 [Muribaculaceae bacterium]|nr:hypothetical protein [Muribaculaceae bacterium]